MVGLLKSCIVCGEISEANRCSEHRLSHAPKADTGSRGYGWTWQKLSRRARRLQPWCSDCGATEDLTTDHSPEAWERHEQGKVIRLQHVDVLCRSCNSKRGAARGESVTWGGGVGPSAPGPAAKAKFESHCESFSVGGEG